MNAMPSTLLQLNGPIRFDVLSRCLVAVDGSRREHLSQHEFIALETLSRPAGGGFASYEDLCAATLCKDPSHSRSLHVLISKLRRKLAATYANIQIMAVYGHGYKLICAATISHGAPIVGEASITAALIDALQAARDNLASPAGRKSVRATLAKIDGALSMACAS